MSEVSKGTVVATWAIIAILLVGLWYLSRGLGYRVSLPEFIGIVAAVIVGGWFADRGRSRRGSGVGQ